MQVSTDAECELSNETRSPVGFARTAAVRLAKLDANATIKWKCAGKFDVHRDEHARCSSPRSSSDGKTYRNYCHLMESSKLAKIEQKPVIKVFKRKPCDSGRNRRMRSTGAVFSCLAPEITLPPVSVSNKTGSNVFLTCEVAGVPLPVVEWVYTPSSGKQIVYPSKSNPSRVRARTQRGVLLADDDRISTLVRGGPNAHVLTSWLQIQSLQRNDQGTYTCVASNTLGKAEKSCRVSVEGQREDATIDVFRDESIFSV